jgi:hypothetical protein
MSDPVAKPNVLNGTDLIHADDAIGPEVAPSISVTTSERLPGRLALPRT